jgi:hypothetical protein
VVQDFIRGCQEVLCKSLRVAQITRRWQLASIPYADHGPAGTSGPPTPVTPVTLVTFAFFPEFSAYLGGHCTGHRWSYVVIVLFLLLRPMDSDPGLAVGPDSQPAAGPSMPRSQFFPKSNGHTGHTGHFCVFLVFSAYLGGHCTGHRWS